MMLAFLFSWRGNDRKKLLLKTIDGAYADGVITKEDADKLERGVKYL
jgi:hypothetical protein